jgi:hypothetical protein
MAEEQRQPQYICWVDESRAFRPAELHAPDGYVKYDIRANVTLGDEYIPPESLELVSSVYLGPIHIIEERLWFPFSTSALKNLGQHRHETFRNIVTSARRVAEEQNVPYFAINVVRTDEGEPKFFTTRQSSVDDKVCESKGALNQLERQVKVVLHPTTQLYVRKE